MTLQTGTGDELTLSEMTDGQLMDARNYWNGLLPTAYFVDSGKYDTIAVVVKEIEAEINRREHDGPPWLAD